MIYNLTEEQYWKLWQQHYNQYVGIDDGTRIMNHARMKYWRKKLKPLYKVSYRENFSVFSPTIVDVDVSPQVDKPGYWGTLKGKEKYITMFLLKL